MNYFDRELSKKLQELGCVSESSFAYYENVACPQAIYYFKPKSDEPLICQAFSWPDLCLPENAKKMWPDDGETHFTEPGYYVHGGWVHTHRHAIIDLLPDYDAIEKYILETIKGVDNV